MAKVGQRIGVIDIGFTKITTLIVEEEAPGKMRVLGYGIERAEGFKDGIPVNIDKATATLRASFEKARGEEMKLKRLPVYVGINGKYIRYTRSEASIRRKEPRQVISEKEIHQVKKEASSLKPPADERFLHLIPLSYSLDDMKGIQDPKDFRDCHRLGVEGLLIHCQSVVLSNLEQLLDRLEIRNRRFVFQPLFQYLTVTEPQEREVGFALIDLGGWTTVSIYKDGGLVHSGVIDMGGDLLTSDLAKGLRIKKEVAEQIKKEFGATKSLVAGKDEVVSLPETASEEKYVLRRVIAEIMEIRLEEILLDCAKEIDSQGYSHSLLAGIILIGGGAKIPGVAPFASHLLRMPARVGIPEGVPEEFSDPIWVTPFSLAKFGFANLYKVYSLVEEDDLIIRLRRGLKRIFPFGEAE